MMVTDTDNMFDVADIMRWFGFYELKEVKGAYHRKVSNTIGMLLALADSPPCKNREWCIVVSYFEKETPTSAMDEGTLCLFEHVGNLGSCLIHSVRFLDIATEAAKAAVKSKTDPTASDISGLAGMLGALKP